mmetsp:Transcript_116220/g.217572  ORF Transcript_116220/g.217572 Transcript_116220/m.217572 type:complete len:204 (-) Transcript_116220:108-719(-)
MAQVRSRSDREAGRRQLRLLREHSRSSPRMHKLDAGHSPFCGPGSGQRFLFESAVLGICSRGFEETNYQWHCARMGDWAGGDGKLANRESYRGNASERKHQQSRWEYNFLGRRLLPSALLLQFEAMLSLQGLEILGTVSGRFCRQRRASHGCATWWSPRNSLCCMGNGATGEGAIENRSAELRLHWRFEREKSMGTAEHLRVM